MENRLQNAVLFLSSMGCFGWSYDAVQGMTAFCFEVSTEQRPPDGIVRVLPEISIPNLKFPRRLAGEFYECYIVFF